MAKRTDVEIQIPVEMIMEILVKLPVRSVCRFRCVSKLWCSVISDPQFVEAHRAFSSSCAHARLLVLFPQVKRYKVKNSKRSYYKSKTIRAELYSVDYPQHSDDCPTQTLNYHQSIRRSAIDCSEISRPVHGLYCLDFHDRVRIWNPTTHESLDIKTVEEMGVVRPGPGSKLDVTNYFGFDPVDKKHKILSISRPWRGNLIKRAIESRVFVLEENCWRKLNDCPPELGEPQIQQVVCIDGVIYSTPYGRSLVAFHVRSEGFQRIPVPEEAPRHTALIEFAGRATLTDTSHLPGEEVNEINLWMLDDLEHQTWTHKTCVLRLGEDFRDREEMMITLQGATPAGELLFAQKGFTEQPFFLLLFHVESDMLRTIELRGIPRHLRLLQDPNFDSWTRVLFHEDRLQELPLKRLLGSRLVAESYSMPYHASMFL